MTDSPPARRTFNAPSFGSILQVAAFICFVAAVIIIGFDATASHPKIFASLIPAGLACWVASGWV